MAVQIENVSKKFKVGKQEFYALRDVSLKIEEGEIFGILGPNGAGKSTLLNLMNGMLIPDSGKVKIFGKQVDKNRQVLEKINFISGESKFHWNLSPRQVLNFYGQLYNVPKKEIEKRTQELIQTFEMQTYQDRKFDTLSTGQRMRLVLAKSMINNPKLIMFDEPTLGLDPDIARKVRKLIAKINKEKNITIILTSHYTAEVEELCKRIAFIDKGEILEIGEVEQVKQEHFSEYELIFHVDKLFNVKSLQRMGFEIKGKKIITKVENGKINEAISRLVKGGYHIRDMEIKKPSLEDYFVEMLK